MKFTIITLFPKLFQTFQTETIIGRAIKKKRIKIKLINLRDFGLGKHKQVDDTTYGGGAGMLLRCEPIFKAFASIKAGKPKKGTLRVYVSPRGKTLTQYKAETLSTTCKHIIILCGRYEGVDQRIIDTLIDKEISIGNYVLSGGELPTMVLMDTISRLLPGVLGKNESHESDSFSKAFEGKKEYPQYTKPATFTWNKKKFTIPKILQSGHHAEIEKWRKSNLIP